MCVWHKAFLGQWNSSVWYYNGRYVFTYVFQIQRRYNIKSEPEYDLGDNDVSM